MCREDDDWRGCGEGHGHWHDLAGMAPLKKLKSPLLDFSLLDGIAVGFNQYTALWPLTLNNIADKLHIGQDILWIIPNVDFKGVDFAYFHVLNNTLNISKHLEWKWLPTPSSAENWRYVDAIASFFSQVSTCTARSAYNVLTAPIGVCSSARLVKYMLAA